MTIASCMDAGEVEEAFKVVSVLNWDLTYCRTHRSQHTWRNASRKTSQSVWRHSRSNRTPLYVLLHEVNSRRSLMQGEDWVSPMFVPKQRVGNMGAFRWPWVKAVWHENKWTSQERWNEVGFWFPWAQDGGQHKLTLLQPRPGNEVDFLPCGPLDFESAVDAQPWPATWSLHSPHLLLSNVRSWPRKSLPRLLSAQCEEVEFNLDIIVFMHSFTR